MKFCFLYYTFPESEIENRKRNEKYAQALKQSQASTTLKLKADQPLNA